MKRFDVPIDKQPTCDKTIDEVLKSVEFQREHNHALVSHQVQAAKVILTYEEQTGSDAPVAGVPVWSALPT